jgi:uncharacterized protein (UPF0548 family)
MAWSDQGPNRLGRRIPRAAAFAGAAALSAVVVGRAAREQRWSTRHWTHHLGTGRERFEAASAALLTWEMHRRSGAWVRHETPPAVAGQRMLSELGIRPFRLPEPCEVLAVVQNPDRTVMHYRALPGHAFEGDERFSVRLDPDEKVTFEVTVRSRPALLLPRLAGPFVPSIQWLFIARCAAVLRRAARAAR